MSQESFGVFDYDATAEKGSEEFVPQDRLPRRYADDLLTGELVCPLSREIQEVVAPAPFARDPARDVHATAHLDIVGARSFDLTARHDRKIVRAHSRTEACDEMPIDRNDDERATLRVVHRDRNPIGVRYAQSAEQPAEERFVAIEREREVGVNPRQAIEPLQEMVRVGHARSTLAGRASKLCATIRVGES
jgi:hypothetical protein